MQSVLEQGSIDKPLTFDVGLIQLTFIPVCSPNTFQLNCAEGLHFSAFFIINVCMYVCILAGVVINVCMYVYLLVVVINVCMYVYLLVSLLMYVCILAGVVINCRYM